MWEDELNILEVVMTEVKEALTEMPEDLKELIGWYYIIIYLALKIGNWLLLLLVSLNKVAYKLGYKKDVVDKIED